MNVPLIVHAVEKYGKEKFDMWINQKHYEIDAPIQPYFYSYRKDLPIESEKVETIEAHPISDCHKKKNFYKYHFKTRSRLVKARSELTFEDNIPFIIRNRIDNPDVFTKYPHTNTLKFLFLDIEQHCPENLPFPTYNEIITSVSYCTNDRKIDTIYLKKETDSDKKLLEKFTEEYRRINPDVIVVFNQGYDIPTILHRCTKNKIHTGKFSKSGKPPLTYGKEDYSIDGVVIYDVYDSVKADQSLSGKVVNRGLKEVSNYFKFPETRSPLKPKEITDLKGTRELIEYNKDDVKRLLFLFDIYWQNIEFNANDLKIPLNTAISMNTSELGMIVIGDEHRRLGIISDGTNYQRYPEIFQRPGKKPSDPNYQGALVDIFQIGLFKPVYKADYSCVDEITEALTEKGWKKYWEITDDDKLFTWNSHKDVLELENPSMINVSDFDGELIYSESRNISIAVTPNHRVYNYQIRGRNKDKLSVNRADELQTYINVPIASYYNGHTIEEELYSNYLRLFAWIITEGCITSDPRITISQRKCKSLENSINYVRNMLIDSGVGFKESKRKSRPDVEFYINTDDSRMLLSLMGNDGKHIPDFIYVSSNEVRETFLTELVYGDGTVYSGFKNGYKIDSRVFTTCDKQMADDIQRLCVLTGYRTTVRCSNGEFFIHIYKRKVTGLRLNQIRKSKDVLYQKRMYKGKVWCPTTENGTWICRRNNKIHITGNSMYPQIMASFNLSPDTTTLLEYQKYSGRFHIEEYEYWYVYTIPDNVLKKDMIIQVTKQPGFSSTLVAKFLTERSIYKKKWKETGELKYRALSDNRKVKANGGVYGNMGFSKHPYGFVPTAIATCGIGRECGQLLIDILNELYSNSVIEIDSVTGDTPIFIKDKVTNLIDIIPIEDLSDGSLRNIVNNLDTLTRNGWKNINYVYCHDVEKNIYTIKGYGARIDVTEDHSLFSKGNEVRPASLSCGDVVDLYQPTDFGGKLDELNKNQAWLLGFFLSDGSIHKRKPNKTVFFNKDGLPRKLRKVDHYDLNIAKADLKLLEKAKDILFNEFGMKCSIYNTMKSSGCYKLYGSERDSIKYIRNMCYCKDFRTKKVPKEILNAPISIVNAFFEGLTDGDGCIATDIKNMGKWSIVSIFKPLASGIAYLLDRRGITYNILLRDDKPHVTQISTHKPKEYCSRVVRKQYSGIVSKIMFEKKKCSVYDLGTDDGTFVAGIGRVICHNTDGAYFTTNNINKKEILDLFDKRIRENFKKELDLSIDIDEYDKGYFYKSKNYILEKKGKKILHGVALTASSQTLLKKKLIDELSDAKLNGQSTSDIIQRYLKMDYPLNYFAMNIKLGMPIDSYKEENSIARRMALLAKEHLKIKPEVGNQYYYIKSKGGYKLFDISTKEDIDYDYYRDEIKKVVDMFNIENPSSTLDKWLKKRKGLIDYDTLEQKAHELQSWDEC